MLIFLIVDQLCGCFSCFRGVFQQVQDSAYNLMFKILFTVVIFQMVHNEKLFRRSSFQYQTFSESPLCSQKKMRSCCREKQYLRCLKLKLWDLFFVQKLRGHVLSRSPPCSPPSPLVTPQSVKQKQFSSTELKMQA